VAGSERGPLALRREREVLLDELQPEHHGALRDLRALHRRRERVEAGDELGLAVDGDGHGLLLVAGHAAPRLLDAQAPYRH
jgi:hypothetical protein